VAVIKERRPASAALFDERFDSRRRALVVLAGQQLGGESGPLILLFDRQDLGHKRASYGDEIVPTVSRQLTTEYGRGFATKILRVLEAFLLELGVGFTFLARQKRITVDREDYYIDLLFYHRKLRRVVAVELKMGIFQASDKDQLELYLRWLEKHEMEPGEETPIGLILCADKSDEHVELLRLDESGIQIASYLTELPPKDLLERKLHESAVRARARLDEASSGESDVEPG
jgi:hypothetical protein